jgi:hypothetical protein
MGACYLPDQIRCFITLPISDVELASPAASECVYPLWDVRSWTRSWFPQPYSKTFAQRHLLSVRDLVALASSLGPEYESALWRLPGSPLLMQQPAEHLRSLAPASKRRPCL